MGLKAIAPIAVAAILTAGAASAQQTNWQYSASFYLFMADTDTQIDTPNVSVGSTLSFSDALDNLDFAFMGAFEAHNGQWGALLDLMYLDLSFGESLSGPAFSSVETDLDMTVVTAAALYRVYQDQQTALDLSAGLRWTEVDTTIALTPGVLPGRSASSNVDWVDFVIGARVNHQFSDRWSGTGLVDWGGFDSDSETWQFLATVNYALNENWLLRGGYRYISFENEDDGSTLNIDQSGPIIGVTYQF